MKKRLILLIGPPLSGKDTYLKTMKFTDYTIISRDDILMGIYGQDNYEEAFKSVDPSTVDKLLNKKIIDSINNNENVIINMTNLTKSGRKKHLNKFDPRKYERIAIEFEQLDLEEYLKRNKKRKSEENKFIPESVIKNMIERWERVTYEEGFDKIIRL